MQKNLGCNCVSAEEFPAQRCQCEFQLNALDRPTERASKRVRVIFCGFFWREKVKHVTTKKLNAKIKKRNAYSQQFKQPK